MQGLGTMSGLIALFLLIVAILALLMPFFVLRIRNEIISMNKKMSKVIALLGGEEKWGTGFDNNMIKTCQSCGRNNRIEDQKCIHCGETLILPPRYEHSST